MEINRADKDKGPRSWLDGELSLLADLRKQGKTVREIAEILERSVSSVKSCLSGRKRPPGIDLPVHRQTKWSFSALQRLRALADSGVSVEEIADVFGLSPGTIMDRIKRARSGSVPRSTLG